MLRAGFVDTCKFELASRKPGEKARGRRRHVAGVVPGAAAAAAWALRREACLSFSAASGPIPRGFHEAPIAAALLCHRIQKHIARKPQQQSPISRSARWVRRKKRGRGLPCAFSFLFAVFTFVLLPRAADIFICARDGGQCPSDLLGSLDGRSSRALNARVSYVRQLRQSHHRGVPITSR